MSAERTVTFFFLIKKGCTMPHANVAKSKPNHLLLMGASFKGKPSVNRQTLHSTAKVDKKKSFLLSTSESAMVICLFTLFVIIILIQTLLPTTDRRHRWKGRTRQQGALTRGLLAPSLLRKCWNRQPCSSDYR